MSRKEERKGGRKEEKKEVTEGEFKFPSKAVKMLLPPWTLVFPTGLQLAFAWWSALEGPEALPSRVGAPPPGAKWPHLRERRCPYLWTNSDFYLQMQVAR